MKELLNEPEFFESGLEDTMACNEGGSLMSTKDILRQERDESTGQGFQVYNEIFDEGDDVYLELEWNRSLVLFRCRRRDAQEALTLLTRG